MTGHDCTGCTATGCPCHEKEEIKPVTTQIVPLRCQHCACLEQTADEEDGTPGDYECTAGRDIEGHEFLDNGRDLVKRIGICRAAPLLRIQIEKGATEIWLYYIGTSAKATLDCLGIAEVSRSGAVADLLKRLDGKTVKIEVAELI